MIAAVTVVGVVEVARGTFSCVAAAVVIVIVAGVI